MKAQDNRRRLLWAKRLASMVAATVVALTTYVFYTSFFSPFARKYEVYEAKISMLRNTLASGEESRREQLSLQEKVRDLNSLLTNVRERIPDGPNETQFLQQVTEAAESTNVIIRAYNRGRIEELATHCQLEVRIVGEGRYEPICRFIDELSKLSRITSVEHMKIEARPGSEIYPIEMRLLLFFHRDPSPKVS